MRRNTQVFIVDDDDAVRQSLLALIASAGFNAEAYEFGAEFPIDLPR